MLVLGSFGGCIGNKLKLMETQRKSFGQNILLGKKVLVIFGLLLLFFNVA